MERKSVLGLIALMVTAFCIGTDFTGAMLLVPAIEASFDADITTSQWVLNIYALFFAMTMVSGGRMGDMYGHRPVLMVGLMIFLAASLVCLFSPSLPVLIVARAVQGIGAGCVWPCMLAFGATRIAKPEERGFVMGLIFAGVTTGNVVGPLISGAAVTLGDWRYFFLANVVLSIAAMIALRILMPKEENLKTGEHVDLLGMTVLSVAVLLMLYGLDVGADWGWLTLPIIGMFALSVVLIALFPRIEKRVREPLIMPQMMQNREFVITVWLNSLQVPAIFIALLYFPQYMQKTLGWSSFESAVGLAPTTVLLAVGSVISGRLYNDFGPRKLLSIGYALVSVGAILVVLLPGDLGYFQILPGMVLIGLGATMSVGPSGTAAVSAVKPERAGLVGGLTFMIHLVYGALAVALATAIMYTVSLSRLGQSLESDGITMSDADKTAINGGSLTSDTARQVMEKFSGTEADKIRTAVSAAFDSGMNMAFVFATASALLGFYFCRQLDESKLHVTEN